MNYAEISKETFAHLYKSRASLKKSPLDQSIILLVELRISQINGCAYCCDIHLEEAKNFGIIQEKLDLLPTWQQATETFTIKERLALRWCEAITRLEKDIAEAKKRLPQHFSDREIVDLSATTAIMNALNRIAISLGT
ncbi:MAG: carboxymuconolactone decarboxylase family protein [Gammaproteobacteria bacterium]